jgi:hypothetical protein
VERWCQAERAPRHRRLASAIRARSRWFAGPGAGAALARARLAADAPAPEIRLPASCQGAGRDWQHVALAARRGAGAPAQTRRPALRPRGERRRRSSADRAQIPRFADHRAALRAGPSRRGCRRALHERVARHKTAVATSARSPRRSRLDPALCKPAQHSRERGPPRPKRLRQAFAASGAARSRSAQSSKRLAAPLAATPCTRRARGRVRESSPTVGGISTGQRLRTQVD